MASRTALASLAAVGSVLAASFCCLPILPFVFAASLAGTSTVLVVMRPYLLAASVLFIGYGFYQAWQSKRCNRKPGILSSTLLGLSAIFVFVSIFFPQAVANGAADLFAGHAVPTGQPVLVNLTPQKLSTIESAFNQATGDVRVLVLLSPT